MYYDLITIKIVKSSLNVAFTFATLICQKINDQHTITPVSSHPIYGKLQHQNHGLW